VERNCAFIFSYEQLWFSGKPCYDFRINSQALPGGCIPHGFIAFDEGDFSEAFLPPYLTTLEQSDQWDAIVAYCRKVVRGEEAEAPVCATKDQENEEIARFAELRRLKKTRKAPWEK